MVDDITFVLNKHIYSLLLHIRYWPQFTLRICGSIFETLNIVFFQLAKLFNHCLEASSPVPISLKSSEFLLLNCWRNSFANLTQASFSCCFRRWGTQWADIFVQYEFDRSLFIHLFSSSFIRCHILGLEIMQETSGKFSESVLDYQSDLPADKTFTII